MRRKQVPSDFSTIHCNIEWHCFSAGTLTAASAAAAISHIAKRVSKDSGTFRAAIPTLAEYLGLDEKTVRIAYHFLIDTELLVLIRQIPGAPSEYSVIDHKEWAVTHPGKCCQKLEPASGDDPLARALHGITGKNFWQQFMVTIRRLGFSDEQIISHAKGVWVTHRANPKGGSFHHKLHKHLASLKGG